MKRYAVIRTVLTALLLISVSEAAFAQLGSGRLFPFLARNQRATDPGYTGSTSGYTPAQGQYSATTQQSPRPATPTAGAPQASASSTSAVYKGVGALIIGVGEYENADRYRDLPGAMNDAEMFKSFLNDAYGKELVTDVEPLKGKAATYDKIIAELNSACEKNLELLYILYAGHGESAVGHSFIVPSDGDGSDVAAGNMDANTPFATVESAMKDAKVIPVETLINTVRSKGNAKHTVILLDACRSEVASSAGQKSDSSYVDDDDDDNPHGRVVNPDENDSSRSEKGEKSDNSGGEKFVSTLAEQFNANNLGLSAGSGRTIDLILSASDRQSARENYRSDGIKGENGTDLADSSGAHGDFLYAFVDGLYSGKADRMLNINSRITSVEAYNYARMQLSAGQQVPEFLSSNVNGESGELLKLEGAEVADRRNVQRKLIINAAIQQLRAKSDDKPASNTSRGDFKYDDDTLVACEDLLTSAAAQYPGSLVISQLLAYVKRGLGMYESALEQCDRTGDRLCVYFVGKKKDENDAKNATKTPDNEIKKYPLHTLNEGDEIEVAEHSLLTVWMTDYEPADSEGKSRLRLYVSEVRLQGTYDVERTENDENGNPVKVKETKSFKDGNFFVYDDEVLWDGYRAENQTLPTMLSPARGSGSPATGSGAFGGGRTVLPAGPTVQTMRN